MSATTTVGATGNQNIDALLNGMRWSASTLTFGFPSDAEAYGPDYVGGEPQNNFEPVNATQRDAVRDALDNVSAVCNLTFVETSDADAGEATLRFASSDRLGTAWAYFPAETDEAGDTWFNNSSGAFDDPQPGNYADLTVMHEVGHALGLKHAHETTGNGAMSSDRDSHEYTVMSYRSYIGADPYWGLTNETWGFPQTLMMYDIAALQEMYGANFDTNSGDTTYSWDPNTGELSIDGVGQGAPGANRVFMTVWDGNGNDTYDLSNYTTRVRIDLRPGEWTTTSEVQRANLGDGNIARGNVANSLLYHGDTRSLIENAVGGSANDTLIGNEASNVLDGRGGRDTVVLAGTRADYVFAGTTANFTATGFGATDTLVNVEFVRFAGDNTTYSAAGVLSGTADQHRDSARASDLPLGRLAAALDGTGTIDSAGDRDVFGMRLDAGETYVFDLHGAGSGDGTLAAGRLTVTDAAGNVLATAEGGGAGADAQLTFTAGADGVYYVVASGAGGSTGSYVLDATASDDFRDELDDRSIPSGVVRVDRAGSAGEIEAAGDVDLFRVQLSAGTAYHFDLGGAGSGDGTLADGTLTLLDADGTVVATSTGGAGDASLDVAIDADGTYYLAVGGSGGSSGSYVVSGTEVDDYRDTITDRTQPVGRVLANGVAVSGTLEASFDLDIFAVHLVAGRTYLIEQRGSDSGSGTLDDSFIVLRNADGTVVALDDDSGEGFDSALVFTPTTTGTYYLDAGAAYDGVGTYEVSVTRVPTGTVVVDV